MLLWRGKGITNRILGVAAVLAAAGGLATLLVCSAVGQGGGAQPIAREDTESCLACHSGPQGDLSAVNAGALAHSQHKDLKCQDCHTSITGAPHTPAMLKDKATCGNCHAQEAADYAASAHSHADKVPGDHPTCVTCHGNGDPHAVELPKQWPRSRLVGLCSHCHGDKARMGRYGVDPDAVPSYDESFHGKALLRFGNQRVAICVDCHGYHAVLPPSDPRAPTNPAHAAQTCSQPGCHPGARVNFAMSGANHLRLKIKESPFLLGELTFFRALIFGMMGLLIGLVTLDLRKKVFSRGHEPRCGRMVGLCISLSFLCLVATIILGTLGIRGAFYTWIAAIVLILQAYLLYLARGGSRRERTERPEKTYHHMSLTVRIQHALLAIAITCLFATGIPLRFADSRVLRDVYWLFGGLHAARLIHRGAAVLLIVTWTWHLAWLILRWAESGFSLKSWTMMPNRKDLMDFIQMIKVYLGLSDREPKMERYNFRNKMDYLAEYWGMPVMVLSGLVLWFPIYFGNRLPSEAVSAALIAHGYEATLALLAVVSWHMYNAHFNPDVFPMSDVFYTGRMPREQMEREHGLELERMESGEAKQPDDHA